MGSAVAPTPTQLWTYELQPAYPLPVVDLSVSIRSRFLTGSTINRMNHYLARRMRYISLSAMIAAIMAPMILILPKTIGQIISVLVCPFVFMSPAAGIIVLRYNIVCLLLRTYDFWFFFIMSTATLIVLAIQVRDIRVAYIPFIWFGMLPQFFVDGALRGERQMVVIGTMAAMAYFVTFVVVTLGLIPEAPAVVVFRYKMHEVPSDVAISSGLVTVLAMYLRNIYRTYTALWKCEKSALVECVSYRAALRLRLASILPPSTSSRTDPIYMQKLRCVRPLEYVDSRQTMLQSFSQLVLSHFRLVRPLVRLLLFTSAIITVIAIPIDRLRQPSINNIQSRFFPYCQVASLACASLVCVISLFLYQRHILWVLLTSFDFVFLAAQLTTAHVCLCVFLQWSSPCFVVCASGLWVLWVMCIDAFPPNILSLLGIPSRFAASIFSLFMVSMVYVIYYLVFVDTEASAYDRVLLSFVILGRSVQFRLTPVFYNCLGTLLPWSLRLLYRLWTYEQDVLVMLDGPVVYANYMRLTHERVHSRTQTSVLATNRRNQFRTGPIPREVSQAN